MRLIPLYPSLFCKNGAWFQCKNDVVWLYRDESPSWLWLHYCLTTTYSLNKIRVPPALIHCMLLLLRRVDRACRQGDAFVCKPPKIMQCVKIQCEYWGKFSLTTADWWSREGCTQTAGRGAEGARPDMGEVYYVYWVFFLSRSAWPLPATCDIFCFTCCQQGTFSRWSPIIFIVSCSHLSSLIYCGWRFGPDSDSLFNMNKI